MNLILSVLIGLSAILFTSCKPPSPEEIQKNRAMGSTGGKPASPPAKPKPPPPTLSPSPPPVTIPSPPDASNGSPPVDETIRPSGTLSAQGLPTWNLCPELPLSDPFDQSWINTKFKANKGQENFSNLYNGVTKIILPPSHQGVFEGFLAYGEGAFAAMAVPDKVQAGFAAAGIYGSGKVFVFGHRDWISKFFLFSPLTYKDGQNNNAPSEVDNQVKYLKNVLIWELGDVYKDLIETTNPPLKFLTNISTLQDQLAPAYKPVHPDFKLSGEYVPNFPNTIEPSTYPLVIVGYLGLNDNDVKSLIDYMNRGGKILIGVRPWYGKYDEYINKILRPAGITYYGTYTQSSNFNKPTFPDLKNSQFNLHSYYSLGSLEKSGGDLNLIEQRKTESSLFPKGDPAFSCGIVRDFEDVSIEFPLKKSDSFFNYGLLLFRNYYGEANPSEEPEIPPAEGVSDFPGIVPLGTPLVERDFTFNLKFSKNSAYRENLPPPNWQATGLYAPPGHTVTVEVTDGTDEQLKNFRIFINTHTDDLTGLYDIPLIRHPILVTYHSLKRGVNKIRNQYGGLIVLEGRIESNVDQFIDLTISDAVEAPWLKEDTTDTELARLKTLNVPWAMIQGPRSVAVLPLNEFKKITSAQKIRDAWSYFHVLEDRLAGKYEIGNIFPDFPYNWEAPHKWPDGRTWHVVDKQIGGGEAHAGNPVMYNLDPYSGYFVDETRILSNGWTLWHEMGHNHQQEAWTTSIDQEVTTNILSAYMQDNGYKYLVPAISPPPFRVEVTLGFKIAVNRLKNADQNIYQTSGTICPYNPSDLDYPRNCPSGQEPTNNDPYRRLIFFMQLIRYTEKNPAPNGLKGYDIISELYRRVRNYSDDFYKNLIKTDENKTDQNKTDNLYRELSHITQIDLTEFFERWGRTISPSVKSEISGQRFLIPTKPIWKCDPYNPAADNPC